MKPTGRDRVIEALEGSPRGLCDDCLSELSRVRPRQQVRQICCGLSKRGEVIRQREICPHCSRQKLVSRRQAHRPPCSPEPPPIPERHPEAPPLKEQTDRLSDYLHRLIQMLNAIDPAGSAPEGVNAGIRRLRGVGLLPGDIAAMMQTVNSLRNFVVKERKRLDPLKWQVAENAWAAVKEWWETKRGTS